MTLKDYLHRITRQWILVVTVTVLFFAGGLAFASIPEEVPTQVYSSSAQVLLIDSQAVTNSGTQSRLATVTAIDLLTTDFVRAQVAAELGITLTNLNENVELFGTTNAESNLLTLIASSINPELPVVVANAAAEVIVSESVQLLNATSQIVEPAVFAEATIDLTRNTSIAKVAIPTVLGFVVGLFVAFVRAWSNNIVFSAQELLGLGNSRVMTVGSRRIRGKDSSVLDEDDLRKVRSLLLPGGSPLLLVNEATEQDFSDFVTSLTRSVSSLGNRVLVIDCDLKSPSLMGLFSGVDSATGIGPGTSKSTEFGKLIQRIDPSTDVIASAGHAPHPEDVLGSKGFQEFIRTIRENYDEIFFLSPSATKVSTPSTLAGIAGESLVVAQIAVSNLANVSKTVEILEQCSVSSISVVVLDSKVVNTKERSG